MRKSKPINPVAIKNAKNEIESNGPKWTVRQWIEDFIDIVDGHPLDLNHFRNPD